MRDEPAKTLRLRQAAEAMRGFVKQGAVPGAVLAWGCSDGTVQFEASGNLGFGRSTPVDARSIFRIFSQTKPITGIAAMMLIEQGRIALDQPLHEIVPDFADMQVVEGEDLAATSPASGPITIRHLLTHTAGFGMAGMTLGGLYSDYGITPGTRGRTPGPGQHSTPASLAEMVARLATLPLAADPGTRFDYSVATDVLGYVVEVASGMPFETFLQTRLFDPLGMVDTGFTISLDQVGRFTDLPEQQGAEWTLADDATNSRYAEHSYPSGGGGLVSTAHDYARFAAMLLGEGELDGVRILKPDTVRLARSNLLPSAVTHCDLPIGQTLSGIGYGAAMSVSLQAGQRTGGAFDWPGDVPAGVFGWPGAGGTACWMDPDRDLFVIFMVQYWPSWLNGAMRPDIIAAAYRDIDEAA